MPDKKSLVILGVGNTIRMDDGAGIRVVEYLERDYDLKKLDITFSYLNTGGLDILDEIDSFKMAIIVDAASMADKGLNPGEFYHLKNLHDLTPSNRSGISSHGVGVFEILKYSEMGGYDVPNPIEIYGIQVKETGFVSEELTPEVQQGVAQLVKILKEKLIKLFNELPPS